MSEGPVGGGGERVAVVVVNYESGPVLASCVASLEAEAPAELVVVDNGSTDGSVGELRRRCPGIAVVDPGRNLGYGAAANRGAAATRSELILVCNPDLSVRSGALGEMATALDSDPAIAVVGPLIRTPEGERYPSARQFPSMIDAAGHAMLGQFVPRNRFTRAYQQADLDRGVDTVWPVDWVSGACFLVRRSAFEQIGGFDERYFMYLEEVDLCWRLGQAGWRVGYAPAAVVTHQQGVSTDRHPYRMIIEHHRSLLRFAGQSTSGWRRALLPLVVVGIGVRAVLAGIRKAVSS
ncbi:MAG TPA: glycosyltransferase family 2 protein [Acidimicrobiales bacterium]|nr:glycosyltransferase family 2 protein [Acidimicrobiales bacterium]